jgi:type II secretory pathway pseudopilin PulG
MLQQPRSLPVTSVPRHRSGVTVIVVLALLAVAMTLFGIWTRSAVRAERQLRQRELQLQCQRLAQAGVARAVARRSSDPSYSGETWNVPAEDLGGRHASSVQITVAPIADGDSVEVRATSIHPVGRVFHVRHTEEARVPVTPSSSTDEPVNQSSESGETP